MNTPKDPSLTRLSAITQRLVCSGIVLCLLYFGRNILIPTVVAIILSFSLMPLVRRLQRWGLNRSLSVVLVVLLSSLLVGHVVLNLGAQLVRVAESLPLYENNIRSKMATIDELTLGKLKRMIAQADGLVGDISNPDHGLQKAAAQRKNGSNEVMTVRLEEKAQTPQEMIGQVFGSALHLIELVGLVFVVLIFILIDYEVLRDRLIRLIGGRNLRETTQALREAGDKLTRYFGAQIAINVLSGIVIGATLYWLGVPEAAFWGALTAISRFIPYVGAWAAMAAASLMAAAAAPGWSMAMASVGVFMLVELSVSQLIEPKLYGHSTGLSPLSVVIGAIFWAGLWGPAGLILATPLTLLLVVVGRYVPSLKFMELLLGDVPGLTAAERFYQRALSGDAHELELNLQHYLRKKSASEYCDHVLVPFMALAQEDFSRRGITELEIQHLSQTIAAILDVLAKPARKKAGPERAAGFNTALPGAVAVVVRHEDPVSDIHAKLVAAIFKSNGLEAKLCSAAQLRAGGLERTPALRMVIDVPVSTSDLAGSAGFESLGLDAESRALQQRVFTPGKTVLGSRPAAELVPENLMAYRDIQAVCDGLLAK